MQKTHFLHENVTSQDVALINTQKKTRLEDIAAQIGCSISTVSRALAGHAAISVDVRERIQKVAEQLSYRLPATGRRPRKTKTRTVGVVMDVLQNNPFMTQLLEHLHLALSDAGYQVLLIMDSQLQAGLSPTRHLLDSYLDGVIFASAKLDSEIVSDLAHRGMPLVLVVRSTNSDAIDTVEIDNVHAGEEAARHLYELGHRRFGLVMGPRDTSTSRDRTRGAMSFLNRTGVQEANIKLFWGEYSSESGYSATSSLLASAFPLTAVIAANDTVALGVLEAAKRHGVDVPRRLSVIGFDDIPLAGSPLIGLTTIRQPVEAMGRLAARRLVDRIEMRASMERVREVLPIHLVQRASTMTAPVFYDEET